MVVENLQRRRRRRRILIMRKVWVFGVQGDNGNSGMMEVPFLEKPMGIHDLSLSHRRGLLVSCPLRQLKISYFAVVGQFACGVTEAKVVTPL